MMERRYKTRGRIIPQYAVFPLLICVTINSIIYLGTEYFAEGWRHYDLTLPIDRMVPVVPAFVIVYIGCYLFWIVNYILIVRVGREHCYRFAAADLLSRIVCGIFYLLLPTTNIRPALVGNDIFTELLRMVYGIDTPTRLFPSIHCLVSWLSYIGIRGQKSVPKGYRIGSCLFALLVCVSTQLTKQHYIVDALGGILLAEGVYRLAFHTKLYRYPAKVFERLYQIIFLRSGEIRGKEGKL